jgi:hypothetical protein
MAHLASGKQLKNLLIKKPVVSFLLQIRELPDQIRYYEFQPHRLASAFLIQEQLI